MHQEPEQQEDSHTRRKMWPSWAEQASGGFLLITMLLWLHETIVVSTSVAAMLRLVGLATIGTTVITWAFVRHTRKAEVTRQQQLMERDEQWRTLLEEYVTGLPALEHQLNETAHQVEQSVIDICDAFSGMANRAQASVTHSEQHLHGNTDQQSSQAGLNALIETARITLVSTLDRIIQSSTYSMRLVYRMEDVECGMQEISNALREIEQIASRTKLLALNTTIEAARFNGQSKGFAVVAAEITRLAERTTHASETIRGLVRKVNEDVRCACDDLRELASTDMSGTVLSQEQVEKTLMLLNTKNETMRASVETAIRNSQELANDISHAVIGLQFQDTVNQRLGHVVAALQEMRAALGDALDKEIVTLLRPESEPTWTERMQQKHTMASERQVLTTQLGADATAHSENNVELF